MVDVDRLKEAVDRGTVQVEHGMPLMPSVAHALLAVARLMVVGQPLWRCETHDAPGRTETHCWEGYMYEERSACRMVEGWWFPTGKDET